MNGPVSIIVLINLMIFKAFLSCSLTQPRKQFNTQIFLLSIRSKINVLSIPRISFKLADGGVLSWTYRSAA